MRLKPEGFRAENEWLANENLELQDMFDTLTDDYRQLDLELESALGDAHVSKEKFQTLKDDFALKLDEKNKKVVIKAVKLSNLVDEYQQILDKYVTLTGTKLVTNKLNTLREQGGYAKV